MKKFIFAVVVVGMMLPGIIQAAPTVVKLSNPDALFALVNTGIFKYPGTTQSRFDFQTIKFKPQVAVDHWKARVWCNKGITVGFSAGTNLCGQVTTLSAAQIATFSLFLNNPSKGNVDFEIKLKAYDKSGKWLATEGKHFLWN